MSEIGDIKSTISGGDIEFKTSIEPVILSIARSHSQS
jgi:hypothetical protein